MKADKLFKAIGEIDEKYINEAQNTPLKKPKLSANKVISIVAVAAAAVFVCSVGLNAIINGGIGLAPGYDYPAEQAPPEAFENYTDNAEDIFDDANIPDMEEAPAEKPAEEPEAVPHESCPDDEAMFTAVEYLHYEGPVMPLKTVGNPFNRLSGERSLDVALSDDSQSASVTDSYLITSPDESGTFTLAYPFTGSFQTQSIPSVTVNGKSVSGRLVCSGYAGGFIAAGDNGESYNLAYPQNAYDYINYANENSVLELTNESHKLSDKVYVYEFTSVKNTSSDAVNPTIQVSYRNGSRAKVLTYGFNGGFEDDENGICGRHFSIKEYEKDTPTMLIAVGNDISDLTIGGYPDGGCEAGSELYDMSAGYIRYESTMGEVLSALTRSYYESIEDLSFSGDNNKYINGSFGYELYHDAVIKHFAAYGPTGSELKERYADGRLDDILAETVTLPRVFYIMFDAEISTDEYTSISASYEKQASYNFYGTDNADLYGFEISEYLSTDIALEYSVMSLDLNGSELYSSSFNPNGGLNPIDITYNEIVYFNIKN